MKSADFVVVLNMLLDQEMLAVNEVCRIEECCASVYAKVSCSQKLLVRRVAAYQWLEFSLFCRRARKIIAELAGHVHFLVHYLLGGRQSYATIDNMEYLLFRELNRVVEHNVHFPYVEEIARQ